MPDKKANFFMPAFMFLLAGIAGFSLFQFTQQTEQTKTTVVAEPTGKKAGASKNPLLGSRRPETVLPDLEGVERNISEWDGKVLLVNFWATWCPPCLREIPAFMELREKYADRGFEVLGIAIDTPDLVRNFVKSVGVNYPVIHGEMDAVSISAAYGNTMGSLPYSALLDREGNIRLLHTGELSKDDLEAELKPLL